MKLEKIDVSFINIYTQKRNDEGDITNNLIKRIIDHSMKKKLIVLSLPPCQGMSIAGNMNKLDPRNQLITYGLK